MTTQLMNSTHDRAAYLLRAAFGVEAANQIEAMLNPACDQTPARLVERLSAALLNEGLWVAVDRGRIAEIIEQQTNLEPDEEEIDAFIAGNYENEFGYPKDALEECIRDLVDGIDWAANELNCFADGHEATAEAYLSQFDDDPSPYAGDYSEG